MQSISTARERGKRARKSVPRSAHAHWSPQSDRDPLAIIAEQDKGRVQSLVPVRHDRMAQGPFAFYRGSAAVMAADLATTATTGARVQAAGDCHLANFGAFATPERNFDFGLNDFDETLPAPWEWDVKRLAASVVLAARELGASEKRARQAARRAVGSYREIMRWCTERSALEVWFSRIGGAELVSRFRGRERKDVSAHLVTDEQGKYRIVDDPPLVSHFSLDEAFGKDAFAVLEQYGRSLRPDIRLLLSRYRFTDLAMKVVGIGSVGTRCAIALFQRGDDLLILQIKEAVSSVLESVAAKSHYANHGERVVAGQHLLQNASDLFLGWTSLDGRDYYVRRFHDRKAAVDFTELRVDELAQYAEACGRAIALGHARSGDSGFISGYLGKSTKFDDAVAEFAAAYADQTEKDYREFLQSNR
jgi:uncharacterized protein (DUF2252 family)